MSKNKPDLQAQMENLWETGTQQRDAMATAIREWRDDAFGIFMHFSPGTVFQGRYRGREHDRDLWGEWIMKRAEIPLAEYEEQLRGWHPDQFDADEWAELVAASGCRYFVFTTKHHDGFALFKSKATSYNIVDYPDVAGPDVFGELTEAIRRRGIKPGFYYSHHLDWHEPGGGGGPPGRTLEEYADAVALPHLKELTTNYGRQYIAWFDCGRPEDLAVKCEALVRQHQPEIMVCSRVGGGLGDFSSEGDSQVPPVRIDGPWETCMTLTHHWAWFPADRDHKPAGEVIRMLATIRSRGGNLLLNIGPDVRGRIPVREQAVLEQVGRWLATHGESIYGVRPTPYADLPWGVCTARPGTLYLHLFTLPSQDTLFLPGLASTIRRVTFLADDKKQPLCYRAVPGGIAIDLASVPGFAVFTDDHDTVIAVDYDGDLAADARPVLDHDLDNRMIPALATDKTKVSVRSYRRPHYVDHGTVAACPYHDYAHGFASADASLRWVFANPAANTFFVNIDYANLTGQPVTVKISVGGEELTAPLPVTIAHDRDWRWFRQQLVGSVDVSAGTDQSLAVTVTTPIADTDRIPSHLEDGKPGCDHDGFMIKSITLKSLVPPRYGGESA